MDLVTFHKTQTYGVADGLNSNFTALQTAIEDAEDLIREAVLRLHGEGVESGCELDTGAGLWAKFGNPSGDDVFWTLGERHVVDTGDVPASIPLEANKTSYVYVSMIEDTLNFRVSEVKTVPSPDGEIFLGSATTDGSTCTAVDMTDMEMIEAEAVAATVATLQTALDALDAALDALTDRVNDIEDELGSSPVGTTYWGSLEKTSLNSQTIAQAIAAAVLDHVTNYQHGDSEGTSVSVEPWDIDAVNQALSVLTEILMVNPLAADKHIDHVTVVWNVWGDGSNGSPDFIDRVNSTWPL